MLFVNDDINDELFKKAAEDYPLKTDNPDFDQVFKRMHPVTPPVQKPQRRKRKYLFLLLLLPLFVWLMAENSGNLLNHNKGNGSAEKQTAAVQDNTGSGTSNSVKANTIVVPADQSSSAEQKKVSTVNDEIVANTGKSNAQRIYTAGAQRMNVISAEAEPDPSSSNAVKKHSARSSRKAATSVQSVQPEASIDDNAVAKKEPGKTDKIAVDANQVAEMQQKEKEIPVSVTGATAKDSAALVAETKKTESAAPPVAKKQEQKNKSAKRFYAGIVAGPDFTAVKLQSVKRAGFSFGAVAGYKINDRVSIETGLLKEKKYYNTSGKYFNTDKLKLPAYLSIDYARGACNMLEMPINVNYSFGKKTNSSWFASAGFSTYFMNKESYDYDVTYYNYTYSKSYDYSTKSTTFLAVINLGGGYTHRLGKIGEIRVAPYIKIPVRKTGTGSLPLQSSGVYIGFIKDLF